MKKIFGLFIIIVFAVIALTGLTASAAAEDVVNIPDAALKAKLVRICNITDGNVKEKHLTGLTQLNLSNDSDSTQEIIKSLSGLGKAINLTWLSVENNQITTLADIRTLTKLTYLNVNNNSLKNLDYISNFSKLDEFNAGSNDITSMSQLSALKNTLTKLRVQENPIVDTSVLKDLTNLINLRLDYTDLTTTNNLSYLKKIKGLSLSGTGLTNYSVDIISKLTTLEYLYIDNQEDITNISPLSALKNLKELTVSNNKISDISAVANFASLEYLAANQNSIGSISSLSSLKKLIRVELSENKLTVIDGLKNCTNLREVYADRNKINNMDVLSYLKQLEVVYLNDNNIPNINAVANLTKLKKLSINKNNVTNIGQVANISSITMLNCSDNQIAYVDALANLTNLTEVDVYGNKISNINGMKNSNKVQNLTISKNTVKDLNDLSANKNLKVLFASNNQIINLTPIKDAPLSFAALGNNFLDLSAGTDNAAILNNLLKLGCKVITTGQAPVIEASGVTISRSLASMAINETHQLTATITNNPANKTLTWSSSNTAVATVSSTGLVKGIKGGTAVITVTTANGKTASCNVTVLIKNFVTMRINRTNALVNGKLMQIDSGGITPIMVNDKTLIPVRFVGENLNIKVDWIDETQQIFLTKGDIEVELVLGSDILKRTETKNGNKTTTTAKMIQAPYMSKGRTLVPVRDVAEAFNYFVEWEDPTVIICDSEMDSADINNQADLAKAYLP